MIFHLAVNPSVKRQNDSPNLVIKEYLKFISALFKRMRIKISHIICAENALSCLTISCRSFLTGTSGTRSRILTSVALGIVTPIVSVVLNVEFVGRDQFFDERSLLTRSMCRNPTKNLTLVSTKVHLQ